jgi:uncharacterized membrane protein
MSHPRHHPPHTETEHPTVEREFELERMVLFTDAVFAIAITLMAIDIRWPELPEKNTGIDLLQVLRPTIVEFAIFILSFFFVGRLWASHLKLFRLLANYDKGLINLNLFLLFFVVTFPFTASGMLGRFRSWFVLPYFLYFGNVAAVFIIHFLICRYIFRVKPTLSIPGHEEEKRYLYIRAKQLSIGIVIGLVVMILIAVIFPGNTAYLTRSFLLVPLIIAYNRIKSRKFRPKTTTK